MNISVLIPSRGRFDKLRATIQCLLDTAAKPDAVEMIVRRDADEGYVMPELPYTTFIVGRRWGYAGIQNYYRECFALSTGKLLWIFDDDTHVQTPHWDAAFIMALEAQPFGVAAAQVSEDGGGYPWAVPVLTRALAQKYQWLDTNTERVMDAYASGSGRGVLAKVAVIHRNCNKTDPAREEHQAKALHNWGAKMREWNHQAHLLLERTL